jgi:hypothetical protein
MDSRYLYVEHLTDLACAACGETVIPASVSHGFSISHVAGPGGEPVRLAPADVRCMLYRTAPDASSRAVTLA